MISLFLRRPVRWICLVFLAIGLVSGCKRGKQESAPEHAEQAAAKRERGSGAPSPRGPLSLAERQEFSDALKGLEEDRGRLLSVYFSGSPLDPFFTRMSLADLLEILAENRYEPGSGDERVILMRYIDAKAIDELEECKGLLLERNDPELANLCLGSIATIEPEEALKILEAVIGDGQLRAVALGNLFNAAARGDIQRAVRLVDSLKNPRERAATAVEVLANADVSVAPMTVISQVILKNPQAFAGNDEIYAIQAIRSHGTTEVLREFDLEVPWEHKLMLGYLIDRGRNGKEDVESYVDSDAGRTAFSEEERHAVMAAFGSNHSRGNEH